MRNRAFFRQFLRNPRQIGAVIPSGASLCRQLTRAADVNAADVILEFGTGTGVVTREILRRKQESARFIGIEINCEMAAATRRRFPEAEIVTDSASRAKEILVERGLESCDCVVSSLPWAAFPDRLQDEHLDAALDALRPGGHFVTFAYVHGLVLPAAQRFHAKLSRRFGPVEMTSVVWANVPPAVVYSADKSAVGGGMFREFTRPARVNKLLPQLLLSALPDGLRAFSRER